MNSPKYSLELDISGFGSFGLEDYGRFLNWDTLTTEGNNLAELMDNACIFTQDQDGGSGPEFIFEDLYEHMQVQIQRLIMQKTHPKSLET